ncbi:MAG: hypothetical protein ACKPEN_06650 [Planktothrix sp.]|uniref:hypothetical protein n=1 Tax=Planktothrix sp. TaxID=3088171 RepID=UPI0038D4402B
MTDPVFDSNFTIYPVCRNSPFCGTIELSLIAQLLSLIAQQSAKIDTLTAKVHTLEGLQANIEKIQKNVQGLREAVQHLEIKDDERERWKDENKALRHRIDWESDDNLSVEDVLNSREFYE